MAIRPYQSKDAQDVRYICLNSDGPCDADEAGQHFLLTTYCDYYIEREPENCFVFADENDKAVGYILCAADFDPFWETFLKDFKTRLDPNDTDAHRYALDSTQLHRQFKDTYPAHMHIDLLPEYQGKGIGPQLIDTLLAHLRAKNCPAIMFSVWVHNTGAMRFYERLGFEKLGASTSNAAYGMKL